MELDEELKKILDGIIKDLADELGVDVDELSAKIDKEFNFNSLNTITYKDLLDKVKSYITDENQIAMIENAYSYAMEKHATQVRKSREPYIVHLLNVAYILANLKMDYATICAGLLHDVIEDNEKEISVDEHIDILTNKFSKEIASLVYGVTNLSKKELNIDNKEERDHANFIKFLLYSTIDIRIIMIKLADRLHNMRTLGFMDEERQKAKAVDTLEYFAPLSRYTGVYSIKKELESLSFKITSPDTYSRISLLLELLNMKYENDLGEVASKMKSILSKNDITVSKVNIRRKGVYSFYKKLLARREKRGLSTVDDILSLNDLFAIKISLANPYSSSSIKTDSLDESAKEKDDISICMRAHDILKDNFQFDPRGERDYISTPKANEYRALHSIVSGPNNIIIHLQIRTNEMDKLAEKGVFVLNQAGARKAMQQTLWNEITQCEPKIGRFNLEDPDSREVGKKIVNSLRKKIQLNSIL